MAENEISRASASPDWVQKVLGASTTSSWVLIDQTMVNRFADLTFDAQFIHVDPERAAASPLGGTIAHGFLLISLLTKLQQDAFPEGMPRLAMGLNYGFDRVRFVSPFPVGHRARAHFKVTDVAAKGNGRYQITTDVELVREGAEQPVMVARWLAQVFPE